MLLPDKLKEYAEMVGSKAKRLAEMQEAGYQVPSFVVISADEVVVLAAELTHGKTDHLDETCSLVVEVLPGETYAVRSAALIEDGEEKSYAGQFMTKLNVSQSDLARAITTVMDDAVKKLNDPQKFSLIVQEYVASDLAGVIFSRDPRGEREMVVEYRRGSGEAVVGGETVKRVSFLRQNASKFRNQLSPIVELTKIADSLERQYDWPQDIEWAVKDGELYVLQSRPITSLQSGQWQGIKYVDTVLDDQKQYFYEQTALAETFHQPRPLAYSILKAIYASDGPVERAYRDLGVTYRSTPQTRLFGNDVYVDRQTEIQSLFPALGYLKRGKSLPRLENLSVLPTTISNWLRFALVSSRWQPKLAEKVTTLLSKDLSESDSLEQRWQYLLKNYKTIFEVNIRSQKALLGLERLLGKDKDKLSGLLKTEGIKTSLDTSDLIGNSLSIDDRSDFISTAVDPLEGVSDTESEKWLTSLPTWKYRGLKPHIENVRLYNDLREQARWVSVQLISHLRRAVESQGEQLCANNPELIYFATIEELLAGTVSAPQCEELRERYSNQSSLILPQRIASFEESDRVEEETQGLSSGQAKGKLVNATEVSGTPGPKILYTNILSPDLTQYFGQIEGIVAEQGGLLSHLAIVAREERLPVVVTKRSLQLGETVTINGSKGTVTIAGNEPA